MKVSRSDSVSDFSLVQGGPLFQLFVRTRLSGTSLEWLHRRVIFAIGLAWLPLLLLSLFGAHPARDAVKVPFLFDVEVHVRLLISLPVLLAADLSVHTRLRSAIQQFITRGIIRPPELEKFHRAVESTLRLRNSVALELGLILLVWSFGIWLWWTRMALDQATWYGTPAGGSWQLSTAGYWYALVSLPMIQFLLVRWYFRMVLWIVFLWRVSRLDLHLQPLHTDGAGGLAFLGQGSFAFALIVFAHAALLAGFIANRIFHAGEQIQHFRLEAAALILLSLLVVLGPLTMYTSQLMRARWRGELDYGTLQSRVTKVFHDDWISSETPPEGRMLSHPDFSAVADSGSAYASMRDMRVLPFGTDVVLWLAATALAPLLPLALTAFSLEELLVKVFSVLF